MSQIIELIDETGSIWKIDLSKRLIDKDEVYVKIFKDPVSYEKVVLSPVEILDER